jgi:hypothetical protein
MGPGSAAHHAAGCGALRRILGTPLASLALETKSGKSAKTCQAPFSKIFLFFGKANQV